MKFPRFHLFHTWTYRAVNGVYEARMYPLCGRVEQGRWILLDGKWQ